MWLLQGLLVENVSISIFLVGNIFGRSITRSGPCPSWISESKSEVAGVDNFPEKQKLF